VSDISIQLNEIKDEIAKLTALINNGALDINVQDQTTKLIDIRLARTLLGPFALAKDTLPNGNTVTLVDASTINVNDKVGIFQDSSNPASYFGYVVSKSTNTLTLNMPFDISFDHTNAILYTLENNLSSITASATSKKIYQFYNGSETPIGITRLMYKMITATAGELTEFGDITALTNGVLIRKKKADGTYQNIYNFRNNSEISLIAYDFIFYDAANPGIGVYGFAARSTFSGQDKHGVAVRLAQDEALEAVVMDNITGITDFKIMAQGHYTDEV